METLYGIIRKCVEAAKGGDNDDDTSLLCTQSVYELVVNTRARGLEHMTTSVFRQNRLNTVRTTLESYASMVHLTEEERAKFVSRQYMKLCRPSKNFALILGKADAFAIHALAAEGGR